MRLREALLVLAALLFCAGADAQAPAMSASAVQGAASAVRTDPLLAGSEKTKVLRFRKDDEEDKPKEASDGRWWMDLISSISAGMRVAIWLVGAGLLIWVLLRLRDWLLQREVGSTLQALPPSHVGSLDIRPESLPADIGGAALALWQRGETRAALSLLYRGALSRLAHVHGVPIRTASTESECLALASARLSAPSQAYLAQLIAGWQTVAYAQRALPPEDMQQLCAGFDAQLPPAASSGGPA